MIKSFADVETSSHSGDGNSKTYPVVSSNGGKPHNLLCKKRGERVRG